MENIIIKNGSELTKNERKQLKDALHREFKVVLPPEKQLAGTTFFFLKENDEFLSMGGLLKTEPVVFDDKTFTVYGVVNVIANIKGKGYGKTIMRGIKDYLNKHDLTAIGFCKPENAGFYAKCGFDIEPHSTQRFICISDGKRITNSDGQIIFYHDSSASFMRKVLFNLQSEVFLPAPNLW